MNNDRRHLTALERARIAYQELERRRQAAADIRRRRARTRNTRVAIVCGAFIGLLAGCLFFYDVNDVFPPPERSREVVNFEATRTGHVRSYVKGDTCQELQFDNVSGGYVGGALVPCGTVVRKEAPPATSGQRVNSIRDAFTR
jgi:hypothetical protein